ncbi:MAG: hypothetical protein AAGE85_04740 [Pseudomonadota bacterium]
MPLTKLDAQPAVDTPPDHDYVVQVAAGLDRLDIRAQFAFPVHRLSARSRLAARYVRHLETCAGEALRIRRRQVQLPAPGITCLRYQVNLAAAARDDRRNGTLHRDNVLVSPSVWFLRPEFGDRAELKIRFEVPAAMNVSAPWQLLDDTQARYRVPPSPENASAAVAFGSFVDARRQVGGATLRIALMRAKRGRPRTELIDWAASAAGNVSLSYGRLPNPAPHVILVPLDGGRGSPVPFGRVIRDGGESIELFVRQNASLESLYADWTATHEFSHLMLPYLGSRNRWISEGFAQYFQNVLLARAGTYSSELAAQKLYEGFRRGQASVPRLSPIAATRDGGRAATMKVYWSGAVLALKADVELRRRSNGTQTLDSVLEAFMHCCLPATRAWGGTELLEKLDELAGSPVFMPLYHRYGNAAGFPDYLPVFAELGIEVDRNRVELRDDAPLASLREAILAPRTAREAVPRGAQSLGGT